MPKRICYIDSESMDDYRIYVRLSLRRDRLARDVSLILPENAIALAEVIDRAMDPTHGLPRFRARDANGKNVA